MYTVVTGAAGFIGSNLVKALNARGESRILAVDDLTDADKFRNLVDCDIADYVDKNEFLSRLGDGDFDDDIAAMQHQGACSDTMATDGRYMLTNNYRYSVRLLEHCQDNDIPFLYASSAAAYDAGPEQRRPSTRSRRQRSTPAGRPTTRPRSRSRSCIAPVRSNTSRFRLRSPASTRALRKQTSRACAPPATARRCCRSRRALRAASGLCLPVPRSTLNIARALIASRSFRCAERQGIRHHQLLEGDMKRLVLLLVTLLFSAFALAAVNINTATKEELDALPGIGPVKAQAIIDYRAKNGQFKTPEDIMKVPGTKEGEFGKLKGQISVSGASTPAAAPAAAKAATPPAAAPGTKDMKASPAVGP